MFFEETWGGLGKVGIGVFLEVVGGGDTEGRSDFLG